MNNTNQSNFLDNIQKLDPTKNTILVGTAQFVEGDLTDEDNNLQNLQNIVSKGFISCMGIFVHSGTNVLFMHNDLYNSAEFLLKSYDFITNNKNSDKLKRLYFFHNKNITNSIDPQSGTSNHALLPRTIYTNSYIINKLTEYALKYNFAVHNVGINAALKGEQLFDIVLNMDSIRKDKELVYNSITMDATSFVKIDDLKDFIPNKSEKLYVNNEEVSFIQSNYLSPLVEKSLLSSPIRTSKGIDASFYETNACSINTFVKSGHNKNHFFNKLRCDERRQNIEENKLAYSQMGMEYNEQSYEKNLTEKEEELERYSKKNNKSDEGCCRIY